MAGLRALALTFPLLAATATTARLVPAPGHPAAVLPWVGRAAAGSRVVFSYVHAGLLDGSVPFADGAAIPANVRALGEPWTFGLAPSAVAAFVADAGLRLLEDLGADDYRARYLGAADRGYAFYRLALCEVTRATRS